MLLAQPKRRWVIVTLFVVALASVSVAIWFRIRYTEAPTYPVTLTTFSNADYPEDPEDRSVVFGNYPHGRLIIHRTDNGRFRFLIEPASEHAARIELLDVDLAHLVAAVPPWVKADPELTKIGLIDREWNRQQVRFARSSPVVRVQEGGDGFEFRALSRVDLARNCLNAGLWELLLFTTEEGEDRVYAHYWFTFPLGLYKQLFEQVNGLSYWDYWWSLEHWRSPAGTPISLDRLRTVEREWPLRATVRWDEPPAVRGEQRLKRRNILSGPVRTYRDWYTRPVRFAGFIPPGRYSVRHPRDTKLAYLADFTGAVLRRTRMPAQPDPRVELELAFRHRQTGESTRLYSAGSISLHSPSFRRPSTSAAGRFPWESETLVSSKPMTSWRPISRLSDWSMAFISMRPIAGWTITRWASMDRSFIGIETIPPCCTCTC